MSKDPYQYFRIEGKELLDGLFKGLLDLEAHLQAANGRPVEPAQVGALTSRLLRLAHTLKGASRVVKRQDISTMAHGIEDHLAPFRDGTRIPSRPAIQTLFGLLDQIGAAIHSLPQAEPVPSGSPASASAPTSTPADDRFDTVRVRVEDLDRLLETFSETLVELRSLRGTIGALHLGGAEREHREIPGHLDRLAGNLARARERTAEFRLLPADAIFPTLRRALRDAADALDRRAELETSGGETKLDANVLHAVKDALAHVVRNSVAHGIEPGPERVRRGKPESGRVKIGVEKRGNLIAFICEDDGRGIDLASVRSTASRLGLIAPSEAESLSIDAAIALLLKGGITTTRDATQVSGRGIGLDAVRNTAKSLNGSVQVSTRPGLGTRVELVVRTSLEAVPILGIQVAGVSMAIPARAVSGTLRIPASSLIGTAGGVSLLAEGVTVPYVPVASALFAKESRSRPSLSVVLVEIGASRIALGVDQVRDLETALVRPLPSGLARSPFVSGVFLNAEGDPQIVLDPEGFAAGNVLGQAPRPEEKGRPRTVLVIDDSLTTRMLEQSILESAGYQVSVATSAEEALRHPELPRFRLFVVDVEMPGMSGFEFIARIGKDPALREIPAILVTSRASAEDRARGLEAGARAHIMKSEFEQGKFLQTIRELIG